MILCSGECPRLVYLANRVPFRDWQNVLGLLTRLTESVNRVVGIEVRIHRWKLKCEPGLAAPFCSAVVRWRAWPKQKDSSLVNMVAKFFNPIEILMVNLDIVFKGADLVRLVTLGI